MPTSSTAPAAWLVLENGAMYEGTSIGKHGEAFGELVFNTAMTGYQEILTDPSYKGQMVMMTYPEIGNYGINTQDIESKSGMHAAGFIVRRLSTVTSNWRAAGSLNAALEQAGVVGIEGIDTRAITRSIRSEGALKCGITHNGEQLDAFLEQVNAQASLDEQDLVNKVFTLSAYTLKGTSDKQDQPRLKRLVAYDFGVKENILIQLQGVVDELIVVPANTDYDTAMRYAPDAIFLSNGPGDPRRLSETVQLSRRFIDNNMPIFGICLGHQLLSLALGLQCEKMAFGHHGGNHPVKDKDTHEIYITSQNHSYCVSHPTDPHLADDIEITHINLNDNTVEGMRHKTLPVMSVQFHPEAAPGPHDAADFFQRFITRCIDARESLNV